MHRQSSLPVVVLSAWLVAASAASAAAPAAGAPEVFAPGVVSGPSNDADASFTPDGDTVVFARDGAILLSVRSAGAWTPPRIAPF